MQPHSNAKAYNPIRHTIRPLPSRETRDLLTAQGAAALAAELDAWWHGRGFPTVKHHIIRLRRVPLKTTHVTDDTDPGLWAVRSNLVAGLPPT